MQENARFVFNLSEKMRDCLKQNPEQKYTAREIAEWILKTYPEKCQEKQNRSKSTTILIHNPKSLIQQIVGEIGSNRGYLQRKYPQIKWTEGHPRLYYYTESTDSVEIEMAENISSSSIITTISEHTKITEHNLYPLLSKFLWSELGVYSKRIDEKCSKNSRGCNGNKWLHPDLVGLENLCQDWDREIKDCVQSYADKKTKLWSFEVKILINNSNIREVFFQAVSNSSWANFGYLVASQIEGSHILQEFRVLSGLHGIGLINLDTKNPSESQIIIPAQEKTDIDWNTANRLAKENRDFLTYIKLIRQFYQTGEIRKNDWDCCLVED